MVFTRSSKLPANVFKIHVLMLDVCWTFAGSCKHPFTRSHQWRLVTFAHQIDIVYYEYGGEKGSDIPTGIGLYSRA